MTDASLKRWSYTALVLPGVLIYAAVIVIPIFYSLGLSFTEWSGFGAPEFVGFDNYTTIFSDPVFLHGLRNNLLIVAVSVLGQIPIGFVLAYVLYRRMVKGRDFFETMIFLPITISAVVVAILWDRIFSPWGLFTALVRDITANPDWIMTISENRQLAILPILFVILWRYIGIYMIIYLANLQKIDSSMIEAAVLDGASESQILTRVILPSMLTVLFYTSILAISGSLKSFDLIFAMTAGGPAHYTEVVSIYMYNNTFTFNKWGVGNAVSIVIVLLSVGLITVVRSLFGRVTRRYGWEE